MMAGGSWKDFVDRPSPHPSPRPDNVEIVWKLGLSMEPIIMAQQRRRNGTLVHTARRAPSRSAPWDSIAPGRSRRSPTSRKSIPPFVSTILPAVPHALRAVRQHQADQATISPWRRTWTPDSGARCVPGLDLDWRRGLPGDQHRVRRRRRQHRCRHRQVQDAVQGQRLPAHQQRGAHQAAAGRRGSVAVPLFRRAHGAGGGGWRTGRIRHPQGGRALLDLQHRHGGEPAAAQHGDRAGNFQIELDADKQVERPAHRYPRPISTR